MFNTKSMLRPSIVLLVILLSAFLSSFPSEASHFSSHHLQRKAKHTKHMREHGRGHRGRTQHHRDRPKRDTTSFLLDKDTAMKISSEESKYGMIEAFPGSAKKSRSKRSGVFAWPPNTLFITEFSLEMPLYAPDGVGIPFIVEVPYEFDIPNITDVFLTGGGATDASESRTVHERLNFYYVIESLFNRFGFDGHNCMLKAVCERAESDILSHGLLGEVLNLILAVSSAGAESNTLIEYMDAEYHGKAIGDCTQKYPKCPVSVFHFFD